MQDRLGDAVRLQHILDAITEVETYIKGVNIIEFAANSMMFNATLRQLEIIGEASNRLSEDLHKSQPNIPWRQMIGLRNMVIHEYFGIDDRTIWTVITVNLPVLKVQIQALLANFL
jgi:uncharacterized protein with HEPN domain